MQNSIHITPSPKPVRLFFFAAGIIATIAYRIIFLLDSFWVEVAWYVGTIGFIFYFGHRALIEYRRARMVKDYELLKTLEDSDIEGEKKEALSYLIETTATSKSRFNSLFIFLASVLVFIMNLVMDIFIG